MIQRVLLFATILLLPATAAQAVNPAHWTIVEQINRTDTSKTWVSTSAIALGKMVWVYNYEITKVTGTVNILFGNITVDITSSIPADMRIGSGETRNLPAVLLDEVVADEASGSSADIFMEIDSLGFGRANFTNIKLGSVEVPLFGMRPVQRINLEASVDIVGYEFGDYNRDFSVDAADYVMWRKTKGNAGENLPADGDNNQAIDDLDHGVWTANFGPTGGGGGSAEENASLDAAVPEPTGGLLILIGSAMAVGLRRSRFAG